jgi:hypothetical protein
MSFIRQMYFCRKGDLLTIVNGNCDIYHPAPILHCFQKGNGVFDIHHNKC